jgi:hypothetical protein
LLVRIFFYVEKVPHTPPSWPENFFIAASQFFEKWLTSALIPRGRPVVSNFFSFVAPLLRVAAAEKVQQTGVYIEAFCQNSDFLAFLGFLGVPIAFF